MTASAMRRWRVLAVVASMAAYLLVLPYAATHLDLARDVYVALRLARGEDLPLHGPLLAGTFHLGPIWYYVLAAPIALGAGWLTVLAVVALVGALQFPLAYLAGKELHSRLAGMLWAGLLLLPSWSTFESLFPGHTQWTATFTLAAIVAALRFERTGKPRYFVGLALACVLAVHAHPSTAGLALIGVAMLALGLRRGDLRPSTLAVAAAVAALPFAPLLVDQISRGLPVVGAAASYLGGEQVRLDVAVAPPLLGQSLLGGLAYWLRDLFGAGPGLAAGLPVLFGCAFAIGALGYVAWLRDPRWRRRAALALLAALAVMVVTALMRAYFPYYMTTVIRVLALGIIAVGLAQVLGPRPLAALVAAAVLVQLGAVAGIAHYQSRGGWPLAFFPLFDVVGKRHDPPRPLLMLPAYAMSRSAAFLCREPVQLHGPYAWHVLHGHALEGRLACGKVDVRLGGPLREDRRAWIGLPRAVLQAAGIAADSPMGPFGLLPVRRVLGEPVAVISPEAPRYPPVAVATAPMQSRTFELLLAEGERLAVSNLAFPFTYDAEPQVSVYADGKLLEPAAGDGMSRVWRCERCAVRLRIEVRAADFGHLDIVTF